MGGLISPIPPPPADRLRKEALKRAVTDMLMRGKGGEELPAAEREAEFQVTGPAFRAQRPWYERAAAAVDPFIKGAIEPVDPETGMPNVELGMGGLAGKGSKAAKLEEKFLNFRRLSISPQEKKALREQVLETIRKHDLDPKVVESQKDVAALGRQLTPEEIEKFGAQAVGIEGRAARDAMRLRVNTLNREIMERRDALPAINTQEELAAAQQDISRMEKDLDDYILETTGIHSEMGRNLVALRMEADSTLDLAHWMRKAQREAGLPPGTRLPDHQGRPIKDAVAKAQDAVASGDKKLINKAKEDLTIEVQKLREDGWLETAVALRKAGLLTGLRTHLRNILGTASFQVLEETQRLPSSIVDLALSMGTGRRTVSGLSPGATWRSTQKMFSKEGRAKASSIMKSGENLQQYERLRGLNFQSARFPRFSKILNTYANSVFKTLSYEDQLFKTLAVHRSLESQARLLASNEVAAGAIKRSGLKARMQELIDNPTESMAAEAAFDAGFATFNNSNVLAEFISAGKRGVVAGAKKHGQPAEHAARALVAAVDLTVPFVRTPTNIAARIADYTPIGASVKVPYHVVKATIEGSLSPAAQKSISQAIGRGATGTGIVLLGYHLAANGRMTGTSEESGAQRAVASAAGQRHGAVKLGDEWLSLSTLSPIGNLLTVGATLHREGFSAAKTAGVAGKTVLDQPVLTGMEDVISAAKSPANRGQRLLESYAGSFVPTIVSDVATLVDPEQALRSTTRGDVSTLQGVTEAVANRLPFVKQALDLRYDVFGDPIKTRPTGIFDPFLTTPATTDLAKAEVRRLRVGVSYAKKDKAETNEEFSVRSRLRGRILLGAIRSVVEDPAYESMSDVEKEYNLDRTINAGHNVMGKLKRDQEELSPEKKLTQLQQIFQAVERDPKAAFLSAR